MIINAISSVQNCNYCLKNSKQRVNRDNLSQKNVSFGNGFTDGLKKTVTIVYLLPSAIIGGAIVKTGEIIDEVLYGDDNKKDK